MSLKSKLFFLYSKCIVFIEYKKHKNAREVQERLLKKYIKNSSDTKFGVDLSFGIIDSYEDYKKAVLPRDYEEFASYIERIKIGETHVLSSNEPKYLLKTSGTSSGSKYIPISKTGIRHQVSAAMKALCFYAINLGNTDFMNYKMIFLQGSPKLDFKYSIPTGRLSGVVYHHIPKFFQRNKLPSYEVNIIDDWQRKVDSIVDEVRDKNLSVMGGIPPWCQQFFEKLLAKTGKQDLKALFPNLDVYIHGGLDFSSYKKNIQNLLGDKVDCIQTFPASEGFFAIQDRLNQDDMLLLLDQGVFYEFAKFNQSNNDFLTVFTIDEVELDTAYEMIITNDSGLWRYRIGDIIQFTSLNPYRIKVIGRTSHFISAFGEHVIGHEIDKVMESMIQEFELSVEDYHVSPNVEEKCYEWRIEWKENPKQEVSDLDKFLDLKLSELNLYYKHLIDGCIINPSRILSIHSGGFSSLRQKLGKEGGQNKVVKLSNDNYFASQLSLL